MNPIDKLLLAVKHALRVEQAHLLDLTEGGEQEDSMAVQATRHNIGIYRDALTEYEKSKKK